MNESRSKNSVRNVGIVFGSKILQMVLSFLVRTLLIQKLGSEILGLDGLFSSVITVLSIADLGLGSAVIYSLYTPIAENDKKTITAYVIFFNKIYVVIGIVIMAIGFSTLPILPYIVNLNEPVAHLEIIYLLTIAGTSASYFFSSRRIIFEADQKAYKYVSIDLVFNILLQLTQIFVIIIFQNYIFVLINRLIIALLNNVVIYIRGNKEYKYLSKYKQEKLGKTQKQDLWTNTGVILCHKVGGVLVSGVDNTIISAFVGTIIAGFYSNYLLIISSITSFITIGINSLVPSVGNLKATNEDIEHHYDVFKELLLINYVLSSFAAIMLYSELNNFITIWIGKGYLLDEGVVLLLCINFYISTMRYACGTFNTAAGYFKQTVIKPIAEGVLNLIVSIVLVREIGILGVFVGTTLSLLLGSVWVDPLVLYKKWFKRSVKQYAIWYCEMATFTGIIGLLVTLVGSCFQPTGFMTLMMHAIIVGVICMSLVLMTTIVFPGRKDLYHRLKRLFVRNFEA